MAAAQVAVAPVHPVRQAAAAQVVRRQMHNPVQEQRLAALLVLLKTAVAAWEVVMQLPRGGAAAVAVAAH
jgi:hypothetical protein